MSEFLRTLSSLEDSTLKLEVWTPSRSLTSISPCLVVQLSKTEFSLGHGINPDFVPCIGRSETVQQGGPPWLVFMSIWRQSVSLLLPP